MCDRSVDLLSHGAKKEIAALICAVTEASDPTAERLVEDIVGIVTKNLQGQE